MNAKTLLAVALAVVLLIMTYGNSSGVRTQDDPNAVNLVPPIEEEEEVELSPMMSSVQRFSQKLGYSVLAKNKKLTEFYFEEIEESLEAIERKVIEHDGMPIADPIKIIMNPTLAQFESDLKTADWALIQQSYGTLIESCNRCHIATEHEFLVILPSEGTPPFNQDFNAKSFSL